MWTNINMVSAILLIVIMFYIIRGAFSDFSGSYMLYSLQNFINNVLFIISILFSIYATKKIFVDSEVVGIFGKINSIIPANILLYIKDSGVLVYLIITPVILVIVFGILVYLRSLTDNIVERVVYFFCSQVVKTPKVVRVLIGMIMQIPKTIVTAVVLTLIISLFGIYYPANPMMTYAEESRVYNYIYGNTVSTAINSEFGRKIPVYVQHSLGELTKEVGKTKVFENSEGIKSIGFIRFQYETKSNEQIDEMAKKIVGKETDDRKKATLLYKWIGKSISYDWDKYNNIIDKKASNDKFGAIPAFNTRKGVCEDYSDLFVAMAKAVGLKVRITVGQGYSMGEWGGHAWNEVYISSEKKWIPLDTTWANAGNYFDNKDFYKNHIFEAVAGEW